MRGELRSSESLGTDIRILARGLPARIGVDSHSAEIRSVSKPEHRLEQNAAEADGLRRIDLGPTDGNTRLCTRPGMRL